MGITKVDESSPIDFYRIVTIYDQSPDEGILHLVLDLMEVPVEELQPI